MRKITLFQNCLTALLLLAGICTAQAQANYTLDTTSTLQGSNNSYAGNCDIEWDGITWNVEGNTKINPWRLGGKNLENTDRAVYTKTPYATEADHIDLTTKGHTATVNSLKMVYSTNADFSDGTEVTAEYADDAVITFRAAEGNFPAGAYYKFVFNVNAGGSNQYVHFAKVEIYNAASTGTEKELKSIAVEGEATDLYQGDTFTHGGVSVIATWEDNTTSDVTGLCTYTGCDMDKTGKQTVTVEYEGKTATYDVEVLTIANTQETAYTVDEAIRLVDTGKGLNVPVYVKGIISKIVTPFSPAYGNITFNISEDGTEEGAQFQFFRNIKEDGVKWTETDALPLVGEEVIGCGKMKNYSGTYEFDSNNYLVYHNSKKEAKFILGSNSEEMTVGQATTLKVEYTGDAAPESIKAESSNADVATATVRIEDGTITVDVTAISFGTTTITLTAPATETCNAATATVSITVTDPSCNQLSIVAKELGMANAEDVPAVYDIPELDVYFEFSAGSNERNNPKYYDAGEGIRLYNGNTMTVNAKEGFEVVGVDITFAGEQYTGGYTANAGTYTDGVNARWTGTASSVVFTASGTSRMQAMTVWYKAIGTGIDNVESATVGRETIYNLAGQRMQKAGKGIYVVGGKKVLF